MNKQITQIVAAALVAVIVSTGLALTQRPASRK